MSGGVRFAPSPTGRFHVGNLRTAWISHTWARALGRPWVVRFEDIDGERVKPAYREQQLADLAELGLVPNKIYLQSARRPRHWELFGAAVRAGVVYPCDCSREEVRRDVAGLASAPHAPVPPYSGACRGKDPRRGLQAKGPTVGWRFKVTDDQQTAGAFAECQGGERRADGERGTASLDAASGCHDFLVARSAPALDLAGLPAEPSFVPAYHWACGIDDHDGAYDLLVRAWDLASAAEEQRWIGAWVEGATVARFGVPAQPQPQPPQWTPPAIFHTSLVTREDGGRLEKRTAGVTLPELQAQGWTPERLRVSFAASFRCEPEAFAPARQWGEPRRQLLLSELL